MLHASYFILNLFLVNLANNIAVFVLSCTVACGFSAYLNQILILMDT